VKEVELVATSTNRIAIAVEDTAVLPISMEREGLWLQLTAMTIVVTVFLEDQHSKVKLFHGCLTRRSNYGIVLPLPIDILADPYTHFGEGMNYHVMLPNN